jgi:sec-independent protein translocase protein TatA
MTPSPTLVATLFGLGSGELIVIFLIVLILFGGANLPKLTRSLGQSVKEFKKAVKEGEEEEKKADDGDGKRAA